MQPARRAGCSIPPASARPACGRGCRAWRVSRAPRVGLLDISKARGDVFLDRLAERLAGAGGEGAALPQAHLHQARARRPATGDRDALRRGDRSPRGLRQLYVVQCARHGRSREHAASPACSWRRSSSSTARELQAQTARRRSGGGLRAASDPGPHGCGAGGDRRRGVRGAAREAGARALKRRRAG